MPHSSTEEKKAYAAAASKKWYEANKEANKEKWRLRAREYQRKWRDADPERIKKINKRWRDANPEKIRDSVLLRTYGITLEQRNEIFAAQGSCCAICKSATTGGRNWHIDHCHKSSKVRGLLCGHCNLMLGHARDNSEILMAAVKYLTAD